MKNTLAATPVTEKAILADLFPYYQRGAGGRGAKSSSIVRVFKQKLLERLDEYYEGDGAGDLVLISLLSKPRRKGYKPPPGEAYRPAFAYNPEHPVQQNYRLGLYHLDQCTPADDGIALDYLEAALSRKRDHAPALLAKAEIFVRRALYYHLRLTPTQSLEVAQRAVRQSLAANDTSWRARAMQGILHCVHSRMNEAQVSFARAIALDAAATRYGAWYYAGFLMAMGRSDEALGIAEERARLCPDDLFAQASKGIFFISRKAFRRVADYLDAGRSHERETLAPTRRLGPSCAGAQRTGGGPGILAHHLLAEDIFQGLVAFCLAETVRLRKTRESWGAARRHATDPPFQRRLCGA